jgi:hypothetical protein
MVAMSNQIDAIGTKRTSNEACTMSALIRKQTSRAMKSSTRCGCALWLWPCLRDLRLERIERLKRLARRQLVGVERGERFDDGGQRGIALRRRR